MRRLLFLVLVGPPPVSRSTLFGEDRVTRPLLLMEPSSCSAMSVKTPSRLRASAKEGRDVGELNMATVVAICVPRYRRVSTHVKSELVSVWLIVIRRSLHLGCVSSPCHFQGIEKPCHTIDVGRDAVPLTPSLSRRTATSCR